ncbi:MAG TPA: NfeD family protein [Polyangiaceae bacterium]
MPSSETTKRCAQSTAAIRLRVVWAFRKILVAVGVFAVLCSVASSARPAPEPRKLVLVAPIEGMIDLGLAPFVERLLEQAQEERAALVVLDVNTFGGRVDAAVAIRDQLLRSRVPTLAFVNKRAISAGALIALAAEKIVMAKGATIGAATPVQMGAPGEAAKPVEEKTVSYVRKEFRATADARKRPGPIAEAMVDADVEIPDVIQKGKLLTLTTEEALKHGVADFEADSLQEVLEKSGLRGAEIRPVEANWAEQVVRFLTHPVAASLLMSLAMLGLLIELRTPGFGVPGIVGVVSLVAFFWGHSLVDLVGWEQVLLVLVGLILLGLEMFVIPGFGVAGVLGILAVVAGLSWSLFGAGASASAIVLAISRVAISSAVALVAGLFLMRFLPALPGGRKLVLATALAPGGRSDTEQRLARGLVGTTLTPLRPAGMASFEGRRVDVVSNGEFIERGQPVEVLRDEGTRIVVTLHAPNQPKGSGE